jgi:hypothetical protein
MATVVSEQLAAVAEVNQVSDRFCAAVRKGVAVGARN